MTTSNLLDEACMVLREQTHYLKNAMDQENLKDVLKFSSIIISELRASKLSPKQYYELYMSVFEELQQVSAYLSDTGRHRRKLSELYEIVQHAGSIIPRIYLVITVGVNFIKCEPESQAEILHDMLQLTKGIQHAMRGLFCRYFLTQMTKECVSDDIDTMVSFLLNNFEESNRLWCRIQFMGSQEERPQREKDRHDLRVLVGAHLVRLSQLEGITAETYRGQILPHLLNSIFETKDTIAQQYLLDCIIQIFNDQWHVLTFTDILTACGNVEADVNLKPILGTLMTRVSAYIKSKPDCEALVVPDGRDVFEYTMEHLVTILSRSSSSPQDSKVHLLAAFSEFCLAVFPDRLDNIVKILDALAKLVKESDTVTTESEQPLLDCLILGLKAFPMDVISMPTWLYLRSQLIASRQRELAVLMVENFSEKDFKIRSLDELGTAFVILQPLVDESTAEQTPENIQFLRCVARFNHLIDSDDHDVYLKLLTSLRGFASQDARWKMSYVLPSIINMALGLMLKVQKEGETYGISVKKCLQFVHKTCSAVSDCAMLTNCGNQKLGLDLWLFAASVANQADKQKEADGPSLEAIIYEFITQALILFEETFVDSKSQYVGLFLIIGCVKELTALSDDNRDRIIHKTSQYVLNILQKSRQVRLLLCISDLYEKNVDKRAHTLQKAMNIADQAIEASIDDAVLYMEILSKYIYCYGKDPENIPYEDIVHVITACIEQVTSEEFRESHENYQQIHNYLRNIIIDLPETFREIDIVKGISKK